MTASGECSLYKIVDFPAESRPRIRMRTSLEPKRLCSNEEMSIPILSYLGFGVLVLLQLVLLVSKPRNLCATQDKNSID